MATEYVAADFDVNAATLPGLNSPPVAGQVIAHDGNTYETIREGNAYILIPPNTVKVMDPKAGPRKERKERDSASAPKAQSVFYNPIQQFNRDLSVLAIKAYGEDALERRKIKIERAQAKGRGKKGKRRRGNGIGEGEGVVEGEGEVEERVEQEGLIEKENGETNEEARSNSKRKSAEMDDLQDRPNKQQKTGDDVEPSTASTTTASHPPFRFRVLDALSATGLRALRYAHEIPFITSVTANDLDPSAIASMKLNITHNALSHKITPSLDNATAHMYRIAYPPPTSHGPHHLSQRYDVIDLDPYGTAVPFLDAALQAITDNGLLCITCTDSGVFASTGYCEKTYALYGGMPTKGPHNHEGGLRLILHAIATAAAKHGIAIEPLLSLNIDFYARVFVRVAKSAQDVKFLAGKTMLAYNCDAGCGAWSTQFLGRNVLQPGKNDTPWYKHSIAQAPGANRTCDFCGSKTHVAGPMWGGPLHNAAFIEKILADVQGVDKDVYQTTPRIEGMLTTALEELRVNDPVLPLEPNSSAAPSIPKVPTHITDPHPFFVNPSSLAKVLHCVAPSDAALRGALRHAGYRAVRSHCLPGSIKTDAPWGFVWRVMREWVRTRAPIREGALRTGGPGWEIMRKGDEATAEEGTGDDAAAEAGLGVNGNGDGDGDRPTPDIITDAPAALDAAAAAAAPLAAPGAKTPPLPPVVFDEVLGRDAPGKKRLVRYQMNPRENWGPMTRAKGSG